MADGAVRASALALAWSLGWRVAAGILAGYYLDGWLGTSPLLTLGLSLAALVSAVRAMILVSEDTQRPDEGNLPRT